MLYMCFAMLYILRPLRRLAEPLVGVLGAPERKLQVEAFASGGPCLLLISRAREMRGAPHDVDAGRITGSSPAGKIRAPVVEVLVALRGLGQPHVVVPAPRHSEEAGQRALKNAGKSQSHRDSAS